MPGAGGWDDARRGVGGNDARKNQRPYITIKPDNAQKTMPISKVGQEKTMLASVNYINKAHQPLGVLQPQIGASSETALVLWVQIGASSETALVSCLGYEQGQALKRVVCAVKLHAYEQSQARKRFETYVVKQNAQELGQISISRNLEHCSSTDIHILYISQLRRRISCQKNGAGPIHCSK